VLILQLCFYLLSFSLLVAMAGGAATLSFLRRRAGGRVPDDPQRRKLEALGRHAAGVAHEVNNLLHPMITLSQRNLRVANLPADIREDLGDILAAGRQCRAVVGTLLAFARERCAAYEPLVFGEAVLRALDVARKVLPPSVTVASTIRERSASAHVHESEVTQVLVNLLSNAADAVDGAGTVTVSLDMVRGAAPHLRLSVSDRGAGMSEETRLRIFDPFFTTKPPGRGTGLGLALVQDIVHGWRGSIDVRSAEGGGTTIEIRVPVT